MSSLTIEEIRDIVLAADRQRLCERMAPLEEHERQALASDALRLAEDIDTYWGPGSKSKELPDRAKELIRRIAETEYPDWRSPRWTSQLLIVGLCDCEIIKQSHKYNLGWLRTDLKDMQQRMLQILDARRPKWLADWLKWEWKQEFPVPGWYLERGLIRSGALPANNAPEYFARMADDTQVIDSSFVDTCDSLPLFPSRRAMLEADPALFEQDLWRLLQVDSSAFRYPQLGWPDLLIELCQDGRLDRSRLLADSLKGLTLPLSVKTLAGLVKFHEQLKPTSQELEALIDHYLRLFHIGNSTVVGMAVTALDKLQKEKRLPIEPFLKNLPGVFLADKKSPAIAGIKLAMKVVKEHPNQRSAAASAITAALQNFDPDIQSAAVEALTALQDSIDESLLNLISESSDFVANVCQPKLKKLIADLANTTASSGGKASKAPQPKTTVASTAAVASAPPKAMSQELTDNASSPQLEQISKNKSERATGHLPPADLGNDRFAHLDSSLRVSSHLQAALQAMQAGEKPAVLAVAKHVVPRRDANQRIEPIGDLNELIVAVAAIIENVDDVIELERILDGISRLHREKPADFDKRVDPLRKQVVKKSAQYSNSTLDTGLSIGLTHLITEWLDMEPIANARPLHWYSMRQWFLRERIGEIIERVQQTKRGDAYDLSKTPVPMLALPTHRGGWIDPVVLVERLNTHYASQHVLVDDYDLAQALLRLTADGRREALGMLGEPDYYNGNTELRYALGDNIHVNFDARHAVIQLAAVRARVISCASEGYQPALPIAHASLGSQQRILLEGALLEDPTVPFELLEAGFSFEPQLADVQDHLTRHRWPVWWGAMSNPMDTDASCLAGNTSHLLDGEATWTAAACRVAVLAAAHDRGELRVLATDAMIEAAGRLLIIPEVFGQAMAANRQHIKLNRVAKVLLDVARISQLHNWIVLSSLETCVNELPELPSDIHLLLSQMLESAIALHASLQPNTCAKLKLLEGKSKSGKLASQLIRLSAEGDWQSSIHAAIIDALQQRAERWQRIARQQSPT